MNAVEKLLNLGNKILEQSAEYQRKGEMISFPLKVSAESNDVVSASEESMSVSFRFTVFSTDASYFQQTGTGKFTAPARGDTLSAGGKRYKIVEFDGVTWKYRFDPFSKRILIFTEREPA